MTTTKDRSFPSAKRQMVTSLVAFMMMIALGRACLASTLFTDISLIPASENQFMYHPRFFGFANVIYFPSIDHNVFMQRHDGGPWDPLDVFDPFDPPYVDRIRVVAESLGLPNGSTFWSFAESGTRYNATSSWQLAGQTIPNLSGGTPDPPVRGAPVFSEIFTLAFTVQWEDYFSGGGYEYLYGWVQLQLDPPLRNPFNPDGSNDLILLGGAYTNDPRGIVVGGEYRVVPEPTSGVLAGFTASLFAAIALLKRKRYPAV